MTVKFSCLRPLITVLVSVLIGQQTWAQIESPGANVTHEPMRRAVLDKNGKLQVQASASSSSSDFNFFIGAWNINNKKLQSRLTNCKTWISFRARQYDRGILRGIGNIDEYISIINGKPFEGMSLRLFDPKTKLWSIYWADSNVGRLDIPVVGSFENGIGEFYGQDEYNGKKIIVRFKWDARDKANPVWTQAFSIDNGTTWEWNWAMYCKRIKKSGL